MYKLTIASVAFCSMLSVTHSIATAEMYNIKNPANKISDPADKMYNPATKIKNPASNIDNPADRMDNPNPLTSIFEDGSNKPASKKPAVPRKHYSFKETREYIAAAKQAFTQDNYLEFLSITEAALRRINAGTLKASKKSRLKLLKYQTFGYGLLADIEKEP